MPSNPLTTITPIAITSNDSNASTQRERISELIRAYATPELGIKYNARRKQILDSYMDVDPEDHKLVSYIEGLECNLKEFCLARLHEMLEFEHLIRNEIVEKIIQDIESVAQVWDSGSEFLRSDHVQHQPTLTSGSSSPLRKEDEEQKEEKQNKNEQSYFDMFFKIFRRENFLSKD